MAKALIGFGLVLVVLGAAGYFGSGMASVTALIPAFFGLPIAICGVVGLAPSRLTGATIVGALFALLGLGGTLSRLIPMITNGEFELKFATASQLVMSVICLVCLVWAGWWLAAGRRGNVPQTADKG